MPDNVRDQSGLVTDVEKLCEQMTNLIYSQPKSTVSTTSKAIIQLHEIVAEDSISTVIVSM